MHFFAVISLFKFNFFLTKLFGNYLVGDLTMSILFFLGKTLWQLSPNILSRDSHFSHLSNP
jgi:hypothetical protein